MSANRRLEAEEKVAYGAQDEKMGSKKLNSNEVKKLNEKSAKTMREIKSEKLMQLNCVVCYEDVCKPFCRFDDCPAVGFKCGVCADGLMCAKCWKKILKRLPLNDEYVDYHYKTLECPVCRTPHEEEYDV